MIQNDGLNQLHAIANSTNITTKAYSLAEGIVKTGYSYAEPVLGYGRPVIEGVDNIANKGYAQHSDLAPQMTRADDPPFSSRSIPEPVSLDYAEKTFPYPFQTKTEQVVADAKKPADQAFGVVKNVYDNVRFTVSVYREPERFFSSVRSC